jgi:hypothetical protein
MKPQRPQRNTLRTLKEYPFKDIVEAIKGIHIAQVLTYLKAENLRVGLLINFNVDKLKEGIKRVIL